MPVKRCILNGRNISSLEDFYDQLAGKLHVPAHFGRNLDALWDVLTTDVQGTFEIVWKDADTSKKSMGKDFERIMKVLTKLDEARGDFKFRIEK